MKFCVKCGRQLADDAVFCNGCGTRQADTTEQPQVVVCEPLPKRKSSREVWGTVLHTVGMLMIVGGVVAVIVVLVLALLGVI